MESLSIRSPSSRDRRQYSAVGSGGFSISSLLSVDCPQTLCRLCVGADQFQQQRLCRLLAEKIASDGDCYMSKFLPHQCGLFIIRLSSTLSLKTVVFFYPFLFLRLLSPRLKYSRLASCINALPYAPYFRQRFAPFFRHRRRSQGYPYRIAQTITMLRSGIICF